MMKLLHILIIFACFSSGKVVAQCPCFTEILHAYDETEWKVSSQSHAFEMENNKMYEINIILQPQKKYRLSGFIYEENKLKQIDFKVYLSSYKESKTKEGELLASNVMIFNSPSTSEEDEAVFMVSETSRLVIEFSPLDRPTQKTGCGVMFLEEQVDLD